MTATDSSVVVAAFASWHRLHELALDVVDQAPLLPAHAALEAYSVLTRLPRDRPSPALVVEFLARRFPRPWLALGGEQVSGLLDELQRLNISGGATYDAVIGATARAGDATLVSCDRRAAITYERLRIAYELIG
ncbi:MAG: PIN domain-containing protein [Gaiellaceae bacterium]